MEEIKFVEEPDSYYVSEAFIAHISNVNSKEDLLKQIGESLHFPKYYGFNWDALSECLKDLSWITQKNVVIVHDKTFAFEETVFKSYFQVLLDATETWKLSDEHFIQIVFPECSEILVRSIINDL